MSERNLEKPGFADDMGCQIEPSGGPVHLFGQAHCLVVSSQSLPASDTHRRSDF
jgi:hypothetical protein